MKTDVSHSVGAQFLEVNVERHIATVWLNRPEKMNALSTEMLSELTKTFDAISDDREIRVVVLRGRGKAFCTGADTTERPQMTPAQVRQRRRIAPKAFSSPRNCTKPVIALVHGYALGSGLELALGCDLTVTEENTKLGLIETVRGSIPAGGGTQVLPRVIGSARAKELILTGRRFMAKDSLGWNLFNYVLDHDATEVKAYELAEEIAAAAPIAVSQAKQAIVMSDAVDLETGFGIEAALYERTLTSQDRAEALKAFQERRPAIFIGE